jgi:hypothetical protein
MIEILSNETGWHGRHDYDANRSFGISTECELDGSPEHTPYAYQPRVIKVDVAMGRGQFETDQRYKEVSLTRANGVMHEKSFFYMKTPQVIEIIGSRLHVLRCSLENMARHIPRPYYKELASEIDSLIMPFAKEINDLFVDVEEEYPDALITALDQETRDIFDDIRARVFSAFLSNQQHKALFNLFFILSNATTVRQIRNFLSHYPSIYHGKKRKTRRNKYSKKRVKKHASHVKKRYTSK